MQNEYELRMERDFYTLRSIKLSITITAFICTIIFICVLNKTMFLSPPNRPGNELVHVSSLSPAPEVDSESPVWTEGISANYQSRDSEPNQPSEGDRPNEELREPADPADQESLTRQQTYNNITKTSAYKVCSYARGKWVVDDSLPLYSGLGCKQWLSKMWACRLTQRTDFAYEKLRWLPNHCKMEEFSASKFLDTRMSNKTLAFIGDSLARQQFQSLMCMLTGGAERPDIMDVGREYGLVKAPHALRPDGWAYLFPSTNTTILFYWSASLCNLEPLDPATTVASHAMHLDRPPMFLKRFIHRFDVVVLNTGHHWNRGKIEGNRWAMHVGGSPRIADIGSAKNLTIHSIIRWADLEIRKRPSLKVFYRTISPRHYVQGDWNTGGSCNNTVPMAVGKEVLQDRSLDPIPFDAVRGTRVNVLDVTAVSRVRDEGHISRYTTKAISAIQDCLHWCLPGIPDTWNELLLAQL